MSAPRIVADVSASLFAEFFSPDDVRRLEQAAAGEFRRADGLDGVDLSAVRVLITGWDSGRLDAALLDRMPELELVAHTGATVKFLVSDELFARGVTVTQAGAGMARSVAEVSLAFTMNLLHRVPEMNEAVRRGGWYDAEAIGTQHDILGASIAVIGASRTGRAYLDLVRALGAKPLLTDPTIDAQTAAELGAELVPLDEAMSRARIVAVHAPTLPETRHLIGAAELALMADGAGLVNTARSWIVDQEALVDELRRGRIRAALDVFDEEPLTADSPFRTLPGVLVTPHRAAGTTEGRLRQGRIVTEEIEAHVSGRVLVHTVSPAQLSFMA